MTIHRGDYAAAVREVDGERALILTALPPPNWSPELLAAWARRADANRTGVCACGATVEMPNRAERRRAAREGRVIHMTMRHEDDCTASDDAIRRLVVASQS